MGLPSALLSEITSTSTTEASKSVDTHEYNLNKAIHPQEPSIAR